VIGQNSRAFAVLMVASTILMGSMPLVRWVVVMFVDCGSVSAILLSASSTLPMLVFVFSHRILNCFGYFVIWFFCYFPFSVVFIFSLSLLRRMNVALFPYGSL
jgi:hypothetical protein